MSDIEQKARDMVLEVLRESELPREPTPITREYWKALCRAIEQHEAFRQEVSDALLIYSPENRNPALGRFIIHESMPDALVDVWGDLFIKGYNLDQFCDALEACGLEIRTKANAHSKTI